MACDIKLDNNDGKFKLRVCGIVKIKNKYLVVDINENKFYCLPGGHVELGEDTETALLREIKEELGYEVKVKKLLAIIQNFFKDKKNKVFHELGYYYIVIPKNKNIKVEDYTRLEEDKGIIKKLNFKWFTADELKNINFKPSNLKELIQTNKFKHIIHRDNEI